MDHFFKENMKSAGPDVDVERANWQMYEVFCRFSNFSHNEAGLRALETAASYRSDDLTYLWQMVELCDALQKYDKALYYLERFKLVHVTGKPLLIHNIEVDVDRFAEYLGLHEARFSRGLGSFSKAESILSDIVSQANVICQNAVAFGQTMDANWRDHISPNSISALANLIELWAEVGQHKKIAEIPQFWKSMDPSGHLFKYWMTSLGEKFHVHVAQAFKQLNDYDGYIDIYREAVESRSLAKDENAEASFGIFGAFALLQSTRQEDQDTAIKLVYQIIENDRSLGTKKGIRAACILARHILHNALYISQGGISIRAESLRELERLVETNVGAETPLRGQVYDPRLALVRLYAVGENLGKAVEVLGPPFQDLLNHLEGYDIDEMFDSERMSRAARLARALTALGDDEHALEAWHLLQPRLEYAELQVSYFKNDAPHCDGCDQQWIFVSDLYVCRDCLSTLLCSQCYLRLRKDSLSPFVCSKNHAFLYVPALDRAAWTKLAPGMMLIKGLPVPREAWLEGLRGKYQTNTCARSSKHSTSMPVLARAAYVIGKFRKATLQRRLQIS